MRSLFANVSYRRLFTAQVVALAGTGLTTVALGLLAYDLAGEQATVVLGTALAIKMVAYVLVSPVVGAIADRVPRRRIMLAANLARAGVVTLLPAVTEVWQVFALIAVLQAASATFTPVFQSVIPDIVPGVDDYTRALSASQLAVSLEMVLGPLLAAAALAIIAYSSLFLGTAAGFVVAAALVAVSSVPAVAERASGGLGARLALGLRLFRATPRLRGLLAFNLVVAATGSISLVTTVTVVRDLLGAGEAQVGLLLAVAGVGTATAAASAPWLSRRLSARSTMLAGGAISIVAIGAALLLVAAPSRPVAVAAWALLGFGPGWITVTVGRVLRDSSAPSQRPALFSAQFSLSHACWLLTYPLTGWLAAYAGFGVAWSVLAGLAVAGTGTAVAAWPTHGSDTVRHRHDDDTDRHHVASARWTGGSWTHEHGVVVDAHHPNGPVPA